MNEKSLNSIRKIVTHAQKAVAYASSSSVWWEDDKCLEAIVFNLAQIGELVRFVEDEIQSQSPQVNWPAMKGLRNRIIHDYDYVKPLVIKSIVQNDLPKLIENLKMILDE
jgi:uncharacterized protein with HEPN domain